jgi:hypothetical protein
MNVRYILVYPRYNRCIDDVIIGLKFHLSHNSIISTHQHRQSEISISLTSKFDDITTINMDKTCLVLSL